MTLVGLLRIGNGVGNLVIGTLVGVTQLDVAHGVADVQLERVNGGVGSKTTNGINGFLGSLLVADGSIQRAVLVDTSQRIDIHQAAGIVASSSSSTSAANVFFTGHDRGGSMEAAEVRGDVSQGSGSAGIKTVAADNTEASALRVGGGITKQVGGTGQLVRGVMTTQDDGTETTSQTDEGVAQSSATQSASAINGQAALDLPDTFHAAAQIFRALEADAGNAIGHRPTVVVAASSDVASLDAVDGHAHLTVNVNVGGRSKSGGSNNTSNSQSDQRLFHV